MSRSGAGPSAILSPAYAFDLVNARRSGVPPSMIDQAAASRQAGDWRGACQAGGFDVQVRPDDVSRRYGTQVRRQLLDDLAFFAPDLLRWHLPRQLRDGGRLQAGLVIPLAEYPADGSIGVDGGLLLTAIIPARRLQPGDRVVLATLAVTGNRRRDAVARGARLAHRARFRLEQHRHFWDARQADRLRAFARTDDASTTITRLQDLGQAHSAWARAGIDLRDDGHDQAGTGVDQRAQRRVRRLAGLRVNLPILLQEARRVCPGADRVAIFPGANWAIVLEGLAGPPQTGGTISGVRAELTDVGAAAGLPVLPRAAWSRPVDADLLRLGLIAPDDLHPLVAGALAGEALASALVQEAMGCSIAVPCLGSTHRIVLDEGGWRCLDHTPEQVAAELRFARFGGPLCACLQAIERRRIAADLQARPLEATERYRMVLAGAQFEMSAPIRFSPDLAPEASPRERRTSPPSRRPTRRRTRKEFPADPHR